MQGELVLIWENPHTHTRWNGNQNSIDVSAWGVLSALLITQMRGLDQLTCRVPLRCLASGLRHLCNVTLSSFVGTESNQARLLFFAHRRGW